MAAVCLQESDPNARRPLYQMASSSLFATGMWKWAVHLSWTLCNRLGTLSPSVTVMCSGPPDACVCVCVCVGLNWELSASGWTAPPLQFLYISLASSGQSRAERGRAGTMTDRAIDKPRSSERKSWCQLSLSLCESSLHSEQIRAQSKWKALLLLTSLSAVHLI